MWTQLEQLPLQARRYLRWPVIALAQIHFILESAKERLTVITAELAADTACADAVALS